jgi:hypothetical protein
MKPSAGVKTMYLIKRRGGVTREDLVANWFANHMPIVIRNQKQNAATGRLHATKYIATLFDADATGAYPWDGVAQLWWDRQLPRPKVPHGSTPSDTFQQKAEPYVPWPTKEYVIIDGSDRLPVVPNQLNEPFPTTRSGFLKVTFLVKAKPGADCAALFEHWLGVHTPNVKDAMQRFGGIRYVVSLSLEPEQEPYAGMAELYVEGEAAWQEVAKHIGSDGMERWIDVPGTLVLRARTEMIGIP